MKPSALLWALASRAKELSNMKMAELRRAASYEGLDTGDGSRGALTEAVLVEEFLSKFEALDSTD